MDQRAIVDEFERQLKGLSKAQYLIIASAIEAAGGEISLNIEKIALRSIGAMPKLQVTAYDGVITMRVSQLERIEQPSDE